MSDIHKYYIDDKYLIRDKSSSDGSQIKYYKEDKWYKIDYYGGEAESEYLSSLLLSCTDLGEDKYVAYEKASINEKAGCVSSDFRNSEDEEFITLYRLYKNVHGRDLANVTSKMDYDDAINYVINFVYNQVGLDITEYLANTFWLDEIILNTDRHFNNYGIIMCGDEFREAPIFDNGKSLLTGFNMDIKDIEIADAMKQAYSKSFSPDFCLNYRFLKNHCTIKFDTDLLLRKLDEIEDTFQKKVLLYQLHRVGNIK